MALIEASQHVPLGQEVLHPPENLSPQICISCIYLRLASMSHLVMRCSILQTTSPSSNIHHVLTWGWPVFSTWPWDAPSSRQPLPPAIYIMYLPEAGQHVPLGHEVLHPPDNLSLQLFISCSYLRLASMSHLAMRCSILQTTSPSNSGYTPTIRPLSLVTKK